MSIGVTIEGEKIILNNDGKIPLTSGTPLAKLGDYVEIPFIENQIMIVYIE